ncbi:MAG: sigma-70 family RNA polymerase sigma factor [Planctomycetota bacterium]|nr:MAG: sigma-70 family RNA polymerase sigma factor [Planctomycetota bacterium]
MSGNAEQDPISTAEVQWAGCWLGPASEEFLAREESRKQAETLNRKGLATEDICLGIVHRALPEHPALQEEFVQYFMASVLKLGKRQLGFGLRRLMDTVDLVQSVWEDFLPEIHSVRFETKSSFLALLAFRLRWKVTDRMRYLQRQRRREDLRMESDIPDWESMARADKAPLAALVQREELAQWASVLSSMPDPERKILNLQLEGYSRQEMSTQLGFSLEEVARLVKRAQRRLRAHLKQGHQAEAEDLP